MSHTWGVVRFQDGTMRYCDYDGTVDGCIPVLVDRLEEVQFREMGWRRCTCPCPQIEPVEIYADYGEGIIWPGEACRHCWTLTKYAQAWAMDAGLLRYGCPAWVRAER